MIVSKEKLKQKFNARFIQSRDKFLNRDYVKLRDWVLGHHTFFDEPAAKGHHNNFPGGLAQHILNYTSALETLCQSFEGRVKFSTDDYDPFVVALGHDLNKIGFYTITEWNKKIDNQWVALKQYGYQNKKDVIPTNALSVQMISKYMEISEAEKLSIYWAEGPWSTYSNTNLDKIWKNAMNYDHRVYLSHTADMISSQMMEDVLSDIEVNKAIREWNTNPTV